ncbi:MAG: hypothetical protein KJ634_01130 [Gammaproteobacteria bacterium]|nr:hypothetical protein [Gammaproteobacteria bacterium]MBU1414200.1 hypothetical protein [Gammaproteobacteria bacterium]
MKKIIVATTLAALALTAHADGWRFLPAQSDANFKFEPTVAGTLNHVDPSDHSSDFGYGIDLNFNCGLIQDPQNRIRTHLQIGHVSKDSMKADMFELSPRYTVQLGKGLSMGAGPSVAVYSVDVPGYDGTLYGIGIAGGVNYRMGSLYLGVDARYHNTQSKQGTDFDNLTVGFKAGVDF